MGNGATAACAAHQTDLPPPVLPVIAAGLCLGVAQNICNTLFHGIELLEPIVVVGGVSKNKKLVYYLEKEIDHSLQTPPDSEYISFAIRVIGRRGADRT